MSAVVMFFVFQFPFCDARSFVAAETHRLVLPQWPLANPGSEFIRSFGQVQFRWQGGIEEWPSEELYCTANRALKFDPPLRQQLIGDAVRRTNVNCLFRRLFYDGRAVLRLQLALSPTLFGSFSSLTGGECLQLIESCYAINVRLRSEGVHNCALVDAGRFLAGAYLKATTRRINTNTPPVEAWWVTAREPLLLVQYYESELTTLPALTRQVMSMSETGVLVHHCWVNRRGRLLPVWFVRVPGFRNRKLERVSKTPPQRDPEAGEVEEGAIGGE